MVTKELVDYVRSTLNKGYSEDQIRRVLLQRNYKKQDIEGAVYEATMFRQSSQVMASSYFSRLKTVLFSPSQFFESVKGEQSFWPSIKFLVLTVILSSVLLSISFVIALSFIPSFAFISAIFGMFLPGAFASLLILQALFFFVFFAIIGSVFLPLILFVGGWWLHLFVKLFKGQGKYVETYKAMAYSIAPTLPGSIISFIPIIGSIAVGIWQIVILVVGIATLHQMSKGKAFLVWLTPFLLMVFVGILASLLIPSSQLQFTPTTFTQPAIFPSTQGLPPLPSNSEETKVSDCVEKIPGNWCYTYSSYSSTQGSGSGEVCADRKEACLNQLIFELAAKNKDDKMCETLLDSSTKEACLDNVALTVAIEKNDAQLCYTVVSDSGKDTCVSVIAQETKNIQLCDKIIFDKDSCVNNIAIDTNDVSGCEKIADALTKSSCLGHIAGLLKNKGLCDKAPNKDECISSFNFWSGGL